MEQCKGRASTLQNHSASYCNIVPEVFSNFAKWRKIVHNDLQAAKQFLANSLYILSLVSSQTS